MSDGDGNSDSQGETPRYSIGELADLGGVSRRTVRYYVQRGLLATPTGLGRGRHYTQRHLDDLIRVRRLQEAGHPLAEITARLADSFPEPGLPQAAQEPAAAGGAGAATAPPADRARTSSWTRIEIADGVELHLRDARPGSRQVLSLGEAIRKILPGERS